MHVFTCMNIQNIRTHTHTCTQMRHQKRVERVQRKKEEEEKRKRELEAKKQHELQEKIR